MWDHFWVGIAREADVLTSGSLGDPAFADMANQQYINTRTGIDTSIGGSVVGKYLSHLHPKTIANLLP